MIIVWVIVIVNDDTYVLCLFLSFLSLLFHWLLALLCFALYNGFFLYVNLCIINLPFFLHSILCCLPQNSSSIYHITFTYIRYDIIHPFSLPFLPSFDHPNSKHQHFTIHTLLDMIYYLLWWWRRGKREWWRFDCISISLTPPISSVIIDEWHKSPVC